MILVTGGSGVIGSRVIDLLLQRNQVVRVFARGQSDWRENPIPHFRKAGVDVISGTMQNEERMQAAMGGCVAVVHCAASLLAPPHEIESTNAGGTERLVRMAEAQGVQRFMHVSCLGASEFNSSVYMQSKWKSEQLVRQSQLAWTIIRPSIVFGRGTLFMAALDYITNRFPVIPVVGSGLNRISPVSADDVANVIVASMFSRETVGQAYDVVGPQSYSLTELLELAAPDTPGRTKHMVKIPGKLVYSLAGWLQKLNPKTPMTIDVLRLLTTDLEGDPAVVQQLFGMKLIPFESSFKRLR